MPLFTLVVSTKGRTAELVPLLESLQRQTFRDFAVVIVDQNDRPILQPLLGREWGFAVSRIARPADRGLSRGRNVGWRAATGEFVAFPDDDCWYEPDFLAFAADRLASSGADILTGRAVDATGRSINGRFALQTQRVARPDQVWTTQIEWVAFFRRSLLTTLDGYDTNVGIGAASPWQACEGQEIVLRALRSGAVCWYDPGLTGRHAELVIANPDLQAVRKAQGYGRGMGHVLRKHRFSLAARAYWILRPLIKALLVMPWRPAEGRYFRAVALGRLEGALGRTVTSI